MGAAKAILVSDDALAGSDALSTAKVLAKAIERAGDVDLVLTATESTDGYTGTIPAQVAELLGWPSLTFAKHVEVGDGKVTIQRQTEAGYDVVEASLPAVVSVTAGVVEPRYPSFKGIMAAKNKPVDQVTVGRPRPRRRPGRLGRRPPEDRVRRRRARARGRREDRGRRRGVRAHRRVPRAAQGHLSSRAGEHAHGSFEDLGLRRGRRRQADERARSSCSPRPASSPTPSRRCTSAPNADALAPALGEHGATKVFTVDPGDALPGVVGAAALAGARRASTRPTLVLFAQSYDGRDALARLSVKLDRPVLTNGTDLTVDGDKVDRRHRDLRRQHARRHRVRGRRPVPRRDPAEVVRGRAERRRRGRRSSRSPTPDAGRAGEAKVLERHVEEREGPKLEEATVVVSGGRGIGSAEAYEPLVERARQAAQRRVGRVARDRRRRLGAVLEAGRPDRQDREAEAVHRARHLRCHPAHGRHEGLRQHHRVNKDGEAPIFGIADLGVVGDVHKVVPKLIEALKAHG